MYKLAIAIGLSLIFQLSVACQATACDPLLQLGQHLIDQGHYQQATNVFSLYIHQHPTDVEGYRGRIEAKLLLRHYSDAVLDYAQVTAKVIPIHPDADQQIYDHYAQRLAQRPNDRPALTGVSFAYWWYFEYQKSLQVLHKLLKKYPNDRYAVLMRGSSRVLSGTQSNQGLDDLDDAIRLDRQNPHVHFIVADANTYGAQDYNTAFVEANLALCGGLDTPRLHAILAVCYADFGNEAAAAEETQTHIAMVTTDYVNLPPLQVGEVEQRSMVPGQTLVIPIDVVAGEPIKIVTDSPTGEIWDTILVLLAPDGTPLKAADDVIDYFAAIDWPAPAGGTYHLLVTSFEAVSTGELSVSRW
jgi:tetratricopeptide (TPR) repeat protein